MAWLDFDGPDVAYTLELYARLVERIVDDLDLAPVTLVGACVGSAAALRYTYKHPDRIRDLVLINTLTSDTIAAGLLGRGTGMTQTSPLAAAVFRFVVRRGWIPRRVREQPMRAAFGDRVDESWAAYFGDQRWRDRRSLLAWISMGQHTTSFTGPRPDKPDGFPPVCSVWGAANRILPLSAGQAFTAALDPDEAHVIDGVGHMAPLERPDELSAIIDAFLARHVARVTADARGADHGQTHVDVPRRCPARGGGRAHARRRPRGRRDPCRHRRRLREHGAHDGHRRHAPPPPSVDRRRRTG